MFQLKSEEEKQKKKNKHKTTKTKRAAQLKLKRNSQLRNCRRTSFVSISFIYIFFFLLFGFAINCVGYFTVKSLTATTIAIARRQVNH